MTICSKPVDNEEEVVIAVEGRFDFSSHKEFRDAYREKPKDARYVIDLSDTDYMDSSALGMLLLLREHAGSEKTNVRIVGCNDEIYEILEVSNFQHLFDIR